MVDGAFYRLNAAMLRSGLYNEKLVALVGKFGTLNHDADGSINFTCADGGIVRVSLNEFPLPDNLSLEPSEQPVVEVMGTFAENEFTMFVVRVLSKDMDLNVYNEMIKVQQEPKYKDYFQAADLHAMQQ